MIKVFQFSPFIHNCFEDVYFGYKQSHFQIIEIKKKLVKHQIIKSIDVLE